MDFLISAAYAQEAATAPAGNPVMGLLFPIALILIFYFLLIRPQARRQREHERMLKELGRGDRVVTTGGIHATIVGVSDDVLTLEIGTAGRERMRVKADRRGIERVLEKAKGGESE